jgi:hypothetical protein
VAGPTRDIKLTPEIALLGMILTASGANVGINGGISSTLDKLREDMRTLRDELTSTRGTVADLLRDTTELKTGLRAHELRLQEIEHGPQQHRVPNR